MAESREVYLITGNDLESVKRQLNSYLTRLADRIDKLEGLRGELETAAGTFAGDVTVNESAVLVKDENETVLHSLGE